MSHKGRNRNAKGSALMQTKAPKSRFRENEPGWIAAALLHVGLIITLSLQIQEKLKPIDVRPSVPVELVTLDEFTNVNAVDPAKRAPEDNASPPETAKTEEITSEIVSEAEPLPLGPPPELEPVPSEDPKIENPRFDPNKQTAKRPSEEDDFDLSEVSALINKKKSTKPAARNDNPKREATSRDAPRQGVGDANALTATIQDYIAAQMFRCWRAPLDQPDPRRLVVIVRVRLNPSGGLDGDPRLISPANPPYNDRPLLVASESALRAVRICAPYRLPPEAQDRYHLWKVLDMRFDPSQMLGQK